MREYINAAWVACAFRTLQSLGLDAEAMFKRFNLSLDDLSHSTALMDAEKVRSLFKELERDYPDFGLQVGLHLHPMSFNSLSLEMMSQPNLHKALQAYADSYHRISNVGMVQLEMKDKELEVSLVPALNYDDVVTSILDAGMATLLTLCRFIQAAPVKPVRVIHPLAEQRGERYQQFYNAPIVSEGFKYAFCLRKEDVQKPLQAMFDGQGEELKRFLSDSTPVALGQKVKLIIAKSLGQKKVTLEYVASQLYMSPRSLQRKLSEEDLLFQDVLENVRRHRARVLFSNPDIPLIKVSSQLGFQSQNGLSRFTRAWMEMSPRELRRKWTPQRSLADRELH